jgi:hypothetical protein
MAKDKFDQLAEFWIEQAQTASEAARPSELYHYTDAAGLFGMLQNGSVWATDTRFLNDRQEIQHLQNMSKKWVIKTKGNTKNKHEKYLCSEILSYCDIKSPNGFFIFSLSSQRDDLSQWRGYAKEGMGFTIGFDSSEIIKKVKFDEQVIFSKVEYNEKNQLSHLKKILGNFKDVVISEINKGSDPQIVCDKAAINFDYVVEAYATFSKHKSFSGENEWRL